MVLRAYCYPFAFLSVRLNIIYASNFCLRALTETDRQLMRPCAMPKDSQRMEQRRISLARQKYGDLLLSGDLE